MLPLMLAGLGILAGNQVYQDWRQRQADEETAGRFKGILGTAPGAMGPPDESGAMGYTGGNGLLADPRFPQSPEMQFATRVLTTPGQAGAGLNLVNQAFGRAQQEQQFRDTFQQNKDQQAQGQQNWQATFDAAREAERAAADRFEREFGFRVGESNRLAHQWGQDFTLRQNADQRAAAEALQRAQEATRKAAEGPELPKLPVGWMYANDGKGGAMAQPIPNTPDWQKGVDGLTNAVAFENNINDLLDVMAGKEQTRNGVRVRVPGYDKETGQRYGVGGEAFGGDSNRLSQIHGRILAAVAELDNKGVLQKGEMDEMLKRLPDPSTWGYAFGNRNASTIAGYEKLRDQVRAKRDAFLQARPWLLPPPPPGTQLK